MAQLMLNVDDDKLTNFIDLLEAAVTAAKLLPGYQPKPERTEPAKTYAGTKTWPKKEWKDEEVALPITLDRASGDNGASDAQCGAAYGILKGYGITTKEDQKKAFQAVLSGDVPESAYDLVKFSKGSVSKLISAIKQNQKLITTGEPF